MSKVRSTKTPEERKAEADALHNRIGAQVEALRSSDQWMAWLQVLATGLYRYSFNNVLLVLSQCTEATRVAGFREWQRRGRQVRKGERSIKIFGYSSRKITTTDPQTGEEEEGRRPIFPILSVFDVSQTDPMEGADPEAESEGCPVQNLSGDDPAGIYDATAEYLTAQGWTVKRGDTKPADGYTTKAGGNQVVIDVDLSDAQAAATILHEAAHIELGHLGADVDYRAERGLCEVEAESVAYVLAGLLELDTAPNSVGYIASWASASADEIEATASRVMSAVHALGAAIIEPVEAAAEPVTA